MKFKLDECCQKIVDIILEPGENVEDIRQITFPVLVFDEEGNARKVRVTDLTHCSIRGMVLTDIYFEDGMRMVSGFKGIDVQNIHFPGTVDYIDANAFSDIEYLKRVTFEDGEHRLTINTSAFENTGVREIEFPVNIHIIGENAFRCCSALKHISFRGEKSNLQKIKKSAFANSSISELTIPNTVAATITIEEDAFKYCDKLKTINFPYNNIKKISKKCFMHCYSLETVTFPTSLREIGEQAFSSSGLKNIDLSNTKVKKIGPSAFLASNVKRVQLPLSITLIDTSAFELCQKLKKINFPAKLKKINTSAFKATALSELDFTACNNGLIINNAFSDIDKGYTIKTSPYVLINDEVLNKYITNLFC